jgi:hypothetical protein
MTASVIMVFAVVHARLRTDIKSCETHTSAGTAGTANRQSAIQSPPTAINAAKWTVAASAKLFGRSPSLRQPGPINAHVGPKNKAALKA